MAVRSRRVNSWTTDAGRLPNGSSRFGNDFPSRRKSDTPSPNPANASAAQDDHIASTIATIAHARPDCHHHLPESPLKPFTVSIPSAGPAGRHRVLPH